MSPVGRTTSYQKPHTGRRAAPVDASGAAYGLAAAHALRPYQRDAVDLGAAHFGAYDRGQLISGCGSGKTRMALALAHELRARRTLVAAPNLLLVGQWVRQIHEFHADDPRGAPRITVLCSNEQVGATLDGSKERVEVTTDPAVVKRILKHQIGAETAADATGEPIAPHYVVATYHSLPVLAEAMQSSHMGVIDFGVADEAHRTTGTDATRPFRTFVLPQGTPGALRIARRLYVTATPKDRPTPVLLPNRARAIPLSTADQERLGVDQLRVIPVLERAHDRDAFKQRLRRDVGLPLPDGSMILVRTLIPRPYVDPEPGFPQQVLHVVAPDHGPLDLNEPTVASSLIVPAEADLAPILRAVELAAGTPDALGPRQSLASLVESYHARASEAFYMDDRDLYGHIIADVPDQVVSAGGYAAPYRVLLCAVSRREVDELAQSVPAAPTTKPEDQRQIAAVAIALSRAGREYDMRHAMAFHQRIPEANALAAVMQSGALQALNRAAGFSADGAGDDASGARPTTLDAAALHSDLSDKAQAERLARFATPPATGTMLCLSAVRIGMEGQDIPAIDTVTFAAARDSVTEVVQIKGRAARLDEDRPGKVATVLLPIVIDDTVDVMRTKVAGAIDPHSARIATSVVGALLTADERAMETIVMDGVTALPQRAASAIVSAAAAHAPPTAEEREDVHDRGLRHVLAAMKRELAGVAPRRYTGVAYDRDANAFRACLAHEPPNARAGLGPVRYLDRTFALASEAGRAIDRVIDEQGLEAHVQRNFARPFTLAQKGEGAGYRGVIALRGAATGGATAADEPRFAAAYELRRLGGAKAGALAVRYAATRDEAARIADALMVRYGGGADRNFPGEPPRHDLAARPTEGRARGVEYDAAVRRWWAYAWGTSADRATPPATVSLGFFANERDAEAAQRHVQVAFNKVSPKEATYPRLQRLAKTALDESGVVPVPLDRPKEKDDEEAAAPIARPRVVEAPPAAAATPTHVSTHASSARPLAPAPVEV